MNEEPGGIWLGRYTNKHNRGTTRPSPPRARRRGYVKLTRTHTRTHTHTHTIMHTGFHAELILQGGWEVVTRQKGKGQRQWKHTYV